MKRRILAIGGLIAAMAATAAPMANAAVLGVPADCGGSEGGVVGLLMRYLC